MGARRRVLRGMAVLAVGAVAAGGAAVPAQADSRAPAHEATQQALDNIVRAGVPGVLAEVRDANGVWKGSSGVKDVRTGAPRGDNDRFRIGSTTKTFTATVLLQMEAEGLLDLDDTVEKWLPGLVSGNGNDGSRITVRQLLNHTSGLYDYMGDEKLRDKVMRAPGFFKHRYDTYTPEQLVRIGLAYPPVFAPGTKHEYTNTGYILAGMIIEKAGGSTYEREVTRRIIKPLGLKGTSTPGTSAGVPRPSGRGYATLSDDPKATKLHDVTRLNPSFGWSAGDMISTTRDLNRFFSSLMRGKVLPPEQLNAMKTTVPDPDDPSASYGLGISTFLTKCGTKLWGHDGGIPGALNQAVTTEDGRHSLAYNSNALMPAAIDPILAVMDAEYCPGGTG
ncbi:serine hydrolase domain-containing protein [Streptomyces sp. NPDC055078]